ncbi:hypothetical protein [Rhizobium tibeticum]|uniref:hypothetical protein n=1 Tax=Rhizobium tibeticum TaxID=501024 RepID=UPI000A853F8E|nr:hypothetical protein [Rhizobium tibeticum]
MKEKSSIGLASAVSAEEAFPFGIVWLFGISPAVATMAQSSFVASCFKLSLYDVIKPTRLRISETYHHRRSLINLCNQYLRFAFAAPAENQKPTQARI